MTMPAFVFPEPYTEHQSVMLEEVLESLEPRPGGLYLDMTAGAGGHAFAIAERGGRVIAFDRDLHAVEAARERLAKFGDRARVVHLKFGDVEAWLAREGIGPVNGLLADLGLSSPQLEDPERGLSFRLEGPIDMRMDRSSGETALELMERLSQDELADIIYQLGEERRSRRVARCIKQALAAGELSTTLELRRAIVRAVGPRRVGGVDPATRTFQALRMAVNQELRQLGTVLAAAPRILRAGGRAVFISFHSLEDRLVKQTFADRSTWTRLTKKPRMASDEERDKNPRSRSAKLRAAVRNADAFDVLGRFDFDGGEG